MYYNHGLAQLYTSLRLKNIETILELVCDRLDRCDRFDRFDYHSIFSNPTVNCGLAGGAMFLAPAFAPVIVYIAVFYFVYWLLSESFTVPEPIYESSRVVIKTDDDNKSENMSPE